MLSFPPSKGLTLSEIKVLRAPRSIVNISGRAGCESASKKMSQRPTEKWIEIDMPVFEKFLSTGKWQSLAREQWPKWVQPKQEFTEIWVTPLLDPPAGSTGSLSTDSLHAYIDAERVAAKGKPFGITDTISPGLKTVVSSSGPNPTEMWNMVTSGTSGRRASGPMAQRQPSEM